MANNNRVGSNLVQELRILKRYIDHRSDEKVFASLKKSGFFDALARRSNSNFDNFLTKIDSVAEAIKCKCFILH